MNKHAVTIETMRQILQPKGTAPLVHLTIRNAGFVPKDIVDNAMDELERATEQCRVGLREANGLEILAILVLLDTTAGLT